MVNLHLGDCLEVMSSIEAGSIDAVITDPPYGTTQCKWDDVIPLDLMWEQIKRVTKPRGAVVLFSGQPFTSKLVMSNIDWFKYCWIWDKIIGRGHLVVSKRPMAQHEDICVFYRSAPTYNPQMVLRDRPNRQQGIESSRSVITGGETTKDIFTTVKTHRYPKTILTFGMDKRVGHPTQKPVALMEYLIRTYTNESDTVLDFTMGSGTTGVACIQSNRNFIGIELDENYYKIAQERINTTQMGLL